MPRACWVFLLLLTPPLPAADYSFCFLKNGSQAGQHDKTRLAELGAAHMRHINAMYEAKALDGAGPVAQWPGTRGIFLFSVPLPEAEKLGNQDPMVRSGEMRLECYPWQGPRRIGQRYRELATQPGFQNRMARRVVVLLPETKALDRTLAAGPLSAGPYKFLAVLDREDIDAVRAEVPGAQVFLWFHDVQIWEGIS